MADLQKASQVHVQVEYEDLPKQKVSHLFVQVEYEEGGGSGGNEPGLFFAQG